MIIVISMENGIMSETPILIHEVVGYKNVNTRSCNYFTCDFIYILSR